MGVAERHLLVAHHIAPADFRKFTGRARGPRFRWRQPSQKDFGAGPQADERARLLRLTVGRLR
eukprot:8669912-Alexandrium_andersonii.AAC.1